MAAHGYTGRAGWRILVPDFETPRGASVSPLQKAVLDCFRSQTWSSVKEGNRNFEELRQNYDWLSETQLRAALRYFELYPEEIEARLQRERQWTPETIRLEPK
jgi:hypothetical protein